MAISYGFFNSINQDRTYNADQMSEYFDGLVSNGVYESVGSAMQVTAGEGLAVNVQSGRAIIDCKWIKNDAAQAITLTTAHVLLPRYTAIVIRLDRSFPDCGMPVPPEEIMLRIVSSTFWFQALEVAMLVSSTVLRRAQFCDASAMRTS